MKLAMQSSVFISCPGMDTFEVFIKQIHYLLKILDVEIFVVLFQMFDFWTLFIPFSNFRHFAN